MNFFELVDQFFQLNSQQPIPPLASKLYVYWLHEFNQARWPQVLYRRANQVYADLPCDKNTFARAVAQLEERGLLHFDTQTRGWELNYGPAADWLPSPDVVKNSPQTPASMVKNSPQPAQVMVKNSPQDVAESTEKLHPMVKNSPPIRNNQYVLDKNQPTPSASACVGEAAEEITPAPLHAENSQLVPPVAEPPHAGHPGPVAAAELPEALREEVKSLATQMGKMWGFSEQHGFPGWSRLYAFAKHQAQQGRLAELREQLAGYQAGHMRPGVRAHKLADWLGDPKHPDGPYTNGVWCSCSWADIAAQVQARPGQPAPVPTKVPLNIKNAAAQQRQTVVT